MLRWLVIIIVSCVYPVHAAAQFDGFYTDKPGYEPGETVSVHASSVGPVSVVVRLLRVDADFSEVARSVVETVNPQPTGLGSFVEVAGLDMGGLGSFTLEGWFYPTLVGGDEVVLMGQLGASEGAAALGITSDGHAMAYQSDSAQYSLGQRVIAPSVLALDEWHHLAAVYDGALLVLYVDGVAVAQAAHTGAVATTTLPFRIGARAEAPGDLSGLADGRFDSWTLWPNALDATAIGVRRNRGLTEFDPAPQAAEVLFYAGFEDAYGMTVADGSTAARVGQLTNHGTPRVAGVFGAGHSLRLNHDQMLDPGWSASLSISIPSNAKPGLYAIQIVVGPDFDEAARNPNLFRALVVRPTTPTPATRIAVVVPVNTWIAYNGWPVADLWGGTATPGITSRRRTPSGALRGGGNNSAYGVMGDHVSPAYYQGWRRPNAEAGLLTRTATGYFHNATMSLDLVRWLESYGAAYDVYTDWDFDSSWPSHDYTVLITHGHHEYWTRTALENLHSLAESGVNLLNLGGNLFVWRVARQSGGVSEVRKWPLQELPLGPADRISGIDGERIGLWRAIEKCRDTSQDYALATTLDLVADPDCAAASNPTCFGRWAAKSVDHWLWDTAQPALDDRFGVNSLGANTIGHEADSWVRGHLPPGIVAGDTPTVLASGTDFGGPLPKANNAVLDALSCAELEAVTQSLNATLVQSQDASAGAGEIVYYRHRSGSHVLSVGSIASPSALGADVTFTALITRALDCFAAGQGCPASHAPDGGVGAADAGLGVADAGGAVDAGMSEGTGDGGCGCRVGGDSDGLPFWIVILGLLAWSHRRRQ